MISALLTVVPLFAPVQGPLPAERGGVTAADAFSDLRDEFKQASLDWRRAQRAAKKEDRSFDEPHPIEAYYGRFEALSNAGDADARLWLVLNVEDTARTPGEIKRVKHEGFHALVAEHASEPLMEDLVKRLGRQDDWLTDEEICALLERVYEENTSEDIRGDAAYRLAQRLQARATDEGSAAAETWYRLLVRDFAGEKVARKAQTQLDRMRIAVGKIAPDFDAEDVDGNAFKLSDYRGKVVVIDFWGFW